MGTLGLLAVLPAANASFARVGILSSVTPCDEKEHIMDKVKERGKQLGALLEDIKAKHKSVGDVRYIGLFSCVELTKDKATHEPLVPFGKDPEGIMGKIVGMLKAKGFNTYSHEACIFVCPPLIITEEELAENMAILDEVLTEVDKMV